MLAGVTATLLGLLALASITVFPTLALGLGTIAAITGYVGYRRQGSSHGDDGAPTWSRRSTVLGMATGIAAVVSTVIVVIVTTEWRR